MFYKQFACCMTKMIFFSVIIEEAKAKEKAKADKISRSKSYLFVFSISITRYNTRKKENT